MSCKLSFSKIKHNCIRISVHAGRWVKRVGGLCVTISRFLNNEALNIVWNYSLYFVSLYLHAICILLLEFLISDNFLLVCFYEFIEQNKQSLSLKLVSAIFIDFFYFLFCQIIALQKLCIFYYSKKLFSFSRYSNFCNFFPFFSHFPDSKGQMEVEWFMMPWICINL